MMKLEASAEKIGIGRTPKTILPHMDLGVVD
jgi:hypothetical protein